MRKPGFILLSVVVLCGWALAQSDENRYELGPIISQTYLPVHPVGSVQYQPAVGAVGSVHLFSWFDFDAAADITTSKPITSTTFAGGRLTQAYFGVRIGCSTGRVSVYGKIRPGLVSFAEAILRVSPTGTLSFGRLTEPAVDIGTVLVIRVSRRFSVRYEAADSIVDYRARVIQVGNPPSLGRTVHNLQIGTGFVFRF